MWKPLELNYDSIKNGSQFLHQISDGFRPALVIKNFYDTNSCKIIVDRIKDISYYDYGTGEIKKIGVFLMAYLTRKYDYFTDAKNSEVTFKTMFDKLEDPRKKIQKLISKFFPSRNVSTAHENGNQYSNGIIRIHENGDNAPLHRDNANFEAPEFYVANFGHQLSCILYLQHSESGGELAVYRELWKREDERFREIGFGYSKEVISGNIEHILVKPKVGDLIITNPLYYHKILPVTGKLRRVTLSMFMAFDNCQNVVTWS